MEEQQQEEKKTEEETETKMEVVSSSGTKGWQLKSKLLLFSPQVDLVLLFFFHP